MSIVWEKNQIKSNEWPIKLEELLVCQQKEQVHQEFDHPDFAGIWICVNYGLSNENSDWDWIFDSVDVKHSFQNFVTVMCIDNQPRSVEQMQPTFAS